MKQELAINGGPKTIDKRFPWPVFDDTELKAVTDVVKSGQWGNPEFAGMLAAEGVPCFMGYPQPLYKQPLFRKKNFMCYAIPEEVDYTNVRCPVTEKACYEEAVWIMQNAMLGTREDMERFADAIIKIQKAAY